MWQSRSINWITNSTRHLFGNYLHPGMTPREPAYLVEVRIEPFRDDLWQFWLTGTPHRNDLVPVQAVTYFKPGNPASALSAAGTAGDAVPKLAIPTNLVAAVDYIDVELVEATRADWGRARTDLQIGLRIHNRAGWPIEYCFTLAGENFNYCPSRQDHYQQDRYGQVSGCLEAGSSSVRRLVIDSPRHDRELSTRRAAH
jgi:hypothetical protein